jgi:large subunit ribosomal protein L9
VKLILTTDVPGIGAPGDIVEVRDGYGRNFLVPQGKAIIATRGAEKQITTIKRAQSAREIRGAEHAREVRSALEALTLEIPAKVTGDGKKLFGSVTVVDIADAVKAAGGPVLDRRSISTEGHIRTTGRHAVTVVLHPDVTAKLSVKVVAAA